MAAAVSVPLGERMRPRSIDEMAGQGHLLDPGRALAESVAAGRPHSMILWGPPGSGKTTLARLVAEHAEARLLTLSAVAAGVKEIRAAMAEASDRWQEGRRTVLFVDEVHRFNKGQQDAFLPYVEDGTVVFIGATTENPSFELNKALLSRARVYRLRALDEEALGSLLDRALADAERGLGGLGLAISDEGRTLLLRAADGDARRLLSALEIAADLAEDGVVDADTVAEAVAGGARRFDKGGDDFYDQVSALHKAIRGSDPDATLYWLARLLDGGCEPLYIARRLIRVASEDIGNADPRALQVAISAAEAYERLGSPEGDLALSQAAAYQASAPKSNRVYTAWQAAKRDVRRHGSLEVPMHLRNAPTGMMKAQGFGSGYRYPHDEPEAYAAGVQYLPDALVGTRYYEPSDRGLEQRIAERLERLRSREP